MEDSLRAIGQTFALLGTPDPRKNSHGAIDFRIARQLRGYARLDPPPNRVKPVPVTIIRHVMALASITTAPPSNQAIADMISLAFFFLLRPGEYTATPSDTVPFTLQDLQCWIGQQRYQATDIPLIDLPRVTFVTLTFTTQKNSVRGEVIGLARSGNPALCPVIAAIRRIAHLRSHNAPGNLPLACYYDGTNPTPHRIAPKQITAALRCSTAVLGPTVGFLPSDISARSLRAAGAMALLCASVDSDIIRLVGRWRSDEMLRYLHVQAEPIMRNFARLMLQGGTYNLLPNQHVPLG